MTTIVMALLYVWAVVFASLIVWLGLYYMGVEIYPLGKGEEASREQDLTEQSNQFHNQ